MTTQLVDDRDTALKVGYESTDWSVFVPFEQYRSMLADWDIKAIMRDNTCIGAAYFRNGEVHASITPEWRGKWVTRGLLKQLFAHENACTKVTPGHEYMFGILSRLGFVQNDAGYFVKER